MKVFIVVESVDYEGYNEPTAVFDSLDKAVKYQEELTKENDDYGNVDIFEMEVK